MPAPLVAPSIHMWNCIHLQCFAECLTISSVSISHTCVPDVAWFDRIVKQKVTSSPNTSLIWRSFPTIQYRIYDNDSLPNITTCSQERYVQINTPTTTFASFKEMFSGETDQSTRVEQFPIRSDKCLVKEINKQFPAIWDYDTFSLPKSCHICINNLKMRVVRVC